MTESLLTGWDAAGDLIGEAGVDAIKVQKQKAGVRPVADDVETLNFKVTGAFKREFKGYAVNRGVTMVELLKEGFELAKKKHRSDPGAA